MCRTSDVDWVDAALSRLSCSLHSMTWVFFFIFYRKDHRDRPVVPGQRVAASPAGFSGIGVIRQPITLGKSSSPTQFRPLISGSQLGNIIPEPRLRVSRASERPCGLTASRDIGTSTRLFYTLRRFGTEYGVGAGSATVKLKNPKRGRLHVSLSATTSEQRGDESRSPPPMGALRRPNALRIPLSGALR